MFQLAIMRERVIIDIYNVGEGEFFNLRAPLQAWVFTQYCTLLFSKEKAKL